jgi:hypothetical protein
VMHLFTVLFVYSRIQRGAFSILSPPFLQQKTNAGSEKSPARVGCIPRHKSRQ